MRPVFLLIAFTIILFSCKKERTTIATTATADSVQTFCECNVVIIDRMKFMNWDGLPDTADIWFYPKGNNFTQASGPRSELVGSNGYVEGFVFYLGYTTEYEYKITLRNHTGVYKIRNYTFNQDSADCNLLTENYQCYNSFSFELNDSTISIPKNFGNPSVVTNGAYTLELY